MEPAELFNFSLLSSTEIGEPLTPAKLHPLPSLDNHELGFPASRATNPKRVTFHWSASRATCGAPSGMVPRLAEGA